MEDAIEIESIMVQLNHIQETVSIIESQLETFQSSAEYEPTEYMKQLYPILNLISPSFEDVLIALNTYLVEKKCVNEQLMIIPPESLYFLFGSNPIPYYSVLGILIRV